MIKLLIADDHPLVRDGLAAALKAQPDIDVVGKAANGYEALELYRLHRPDVTLMDLKMPDMDGIAAINAIRSEFPGAHVVVLTTCMGDEDIYRALRAGAIGYVFKEASVGQILEAVHAANSGKRYVTQEVASKLVDRVNSSQLTERELEVLSLVAEGKANQHIAGALHISEGTVKSHMSNILLKLNADDRTQAVTEALRRGILHLN